ncbi:MAG: hypothetical protein V3U98_05265 [Acidobacteriota bacterium]
MDDLEDILQKFVPKQLYDELRHDHDRLLIRLGRMEEQLLMLSDYRLEAEERTEIIDRKVRRAERSGRRRARRMVDDEEERQSRRPWGRSRRKSREAGLDSDELDETLAEESTEELIRRLRERYQEISRLRGRLRDEEE